MAKMMPLRNPLYSLVNKPFVSRPVSTRNVCRVAKSSAVPSLFKSTSFSLSDGNRARLSND